MLEVVHFHVQIVVIWHSIKLSFLSSHSRPNMQSMQVNALLWSLITISFQIIIFYACFGPDRVWYLTATFTTCYRWKFTNIASCVSFGQIYLDCNKNHVTTNTSRCTVSMPPGLLLWLLVTGVQVPKSDDRMFVKI